MQRLRDLGDDLGAERRQAEHEADARRKQAENERPAYKRRMWELFEQHHYMSAELSMQSTCAIARWGGTPVGFIAVMPRPGILKASDPRVVHREHRLVVLPEYQGLGLLAAGLEERPGLRRQGGGDLRKHRERVSGTRKPNTLRTK